MPRSTRPHNPNARARERVENRQSEGVGRMGFSGGRVLYLTSPLEGEVAAQRRVGGESYGEKGASLRWIAPHPPPARRVCRPVGRLDSPAEAPPTSPSRGEVKDETEPERIETTWRYTPVKSAMTPCQRAARS